MMGSIREEKAMAKIEEAWEVALFDIEGNRLARALRTNSEGRAQEYAQYLNAFKTSHATTRWSAVPADQS
jgi:hypothetical protein